MIVTYVKPMRSAATWVKPDLALVVLLALALAVRLATFNGMFGSDDVVYFARASQLAHGNWASADYNGALRYGFNLPAAGFMALFGESVFVANLWPLVSSLIEVSAVYMFASAAMNRRAGVFAALLLASAPLHIGVATRIHADPVVSMFLTVGFVMLYFGLQRNRSSLLFGAGLAIGGIFWAKELVAVTWFAFLPLLWFCRGRWKTVLPVLAGATLMMVLHGVLMTVIAGDPLHLVRVVLGAVKRNFVDGGDGEDGAAYYLRYLFVDLRHTGLLGFFAAAAFWLLPRWIRSQRLSFDGILFAMLWLTGLLLVLSLFPVSFSPLRLTMKQSNYITLFLAPTALLAGMGLATLPKLAGRVVLGAGVAFGLLVGALQQADYRTFTANSKAVAEFAVEHPGALIVGSRNNSWVGSFWADSEHAGLPRAKISSFLDAVDNTSDFQALQRSSTVLYAVLDQQTMNWHAGASPVLKPLSCWEPMQSLAPRDLGLGNRVAALLSTMMGAVGPLSTALARIAGPQRADIYLVKGSDVLCRGD